MRTVSIRLSDLERATIPIGFVGENEHTQVRVDCLKLYEEYPSAAASLTVKPPRGDSYPGVVTREDNTVVWVVSDSDLIHEGNGEIQLSFVVGEVVAKSYIGRIKISRSITPTGEVPEPIDDFLTQASAALTAIPETINTALAEAKASGEFDGKDGEDGQDGHSPVVTATKVGKVTTISVDGEPIVTINDGVDGQDGTDGTDGADGHTPVLTAIKVGGVTTVYSDGVQIAQINDGQNGSNGADGYSPTATVSKVGKVSTLTVTDKNGTTSVQINDGQDGQGGDVIDDTSTASDKAWSAQKVNSELSSVNIALSAKISEPQTEGTNGQVLTTDGNGGRSWTTVQGGGSVVTDKTLTIQDSPADAKAVGDIVFGLTEIVKSKNLYNKAACNPQNGKWYINASGLVEDAEKYAITGKMPVEANTQYIFGTNGLAKVKKAFYYSGSDGATYLSSETLDNAAFTTPNNCTFVAFNLFAATHTVETYNAAIAVAQLETGNVATQYVPYSETRKVKTDRLVDGQAVEGAINYTVADSLINHFDKSLCVDKKYFNSTYSEIYDGNNYGFTGLIPVKPNTQYNISCDKTLAIGNMATYYQEWGINRAFIRHTQQKDAFSYISQIQTGATTHYISLNLTFGAAHTTAQFNALIDTIMLVEGTQIPPAYVPYNSEPVVDHMKLDNMYQLNMDKWKGKKWLVTGTSVSYQDSHVFTGGIHEGEVCRGYIGNVSRNKPMLITKEGVSGSTLAGSDQDSLINRYQNLNFANYDFITIEYGINDFGNNVPVGTENDAAGTDTFAACLKTIIEYALEQNPIVGLIICTEPDVRGTTVNQNGNTLKDYTDVTLAIAKQYRLPVCDWYYNAGFNPLSKGDTTHYYLTADGTHPSDYGHMRMGAMLNQVFDSLLC